MVLAPECKAEVLSIAKKNSLFTESCLADDNFVSPNLEEQFIENEKAANAMFSSRKCHNKWRSSNLADILQSFKSGQLTLVGPAGSGKTTLVKMITQSVIQHKYENLKNVEVVIIIDHAFEENVPATGMDLIFRSLLSAGMREKSRLMVMEHAVKYPETVLFVLDGLDIMKLEDGWPSHTKDINEVALPAEHLKNFLSGRYLRGCRIITSGRYQILRSSDKKVYPNRIVALSGFSKEGIEKVIFGCLGKEKAERVLHRLEDKMKPLLSLCSSPAILKYTLCVIDTHDGIINTITEILMIILDRVQVDSSNKSDFQTIMEDLKLMAFEGVRDKDVLFSKTHLQRYGLSEEQVTALSLQCGWGSDFKLIQKCSHCFFTHMSMQEAFAALYLAKLPRKEYNNFIQNKVNHPEFVLVRQFLHGMLSSYSKGNKYKFATVDDADFKLKQLFINDASILKKQFSGDGNLDYKEVLDIFYCLYESQQMPNDIRLIIKNIEFKNLPISASDAHIIGWVIGCCSEIEGISFWNCTLNSPVFETLEEAVVKRNVKIRSLNIHENDDFDPAAMVHIGKMAGHCSVDGMVFQGCGVSPKHIMNLQRNLVKINSLIFWGKTKMGEDFLSAILPLIPKVSTYLALDMWEVSSSDKKAIQNALDELDDSDLKVNIYPQEIIECSKKNIKRCLSIRSSDDDFQSKKRKYSTDIKPTRKHRETPVIADRMAARIQGKISQFSKSAELNELDLSYLPLHQTNAENVWSALTKKKTTENLKFRSCLKQGFIQHLQKHSAASLVPPVVVRVDVSANPDFGVQNATLLGNLLTTWKTTCLDLSECHFTYDEIIKLRDSTTTHEIRKLLFNNNVMSPHTLTALSSFSASSCITALHLENCNLKNEHLEALESQVHRTKLETLDLSYNREMASNGYAAVGRIVHKSPISSVLLVDCDTVLQELQSFQIELNGKSLKHLDLSYNDGLVEDDTKRDVAKTLMLIGPATLSLSGCGADAEMLQDMANSSIGDKLTRLDIRDNPQLGQDSVEVVITIVEKLSLVTLDIDNCGWSQSDILTLPDSIRAAVGTGNKLLKSA